MRSDAFFYKFFSWVPNFICPVIDIPEPSTGSYVFYSEEIKEVILTIDGVFKLPDGLQPVRIIEFYNFKNKDAYINIYLKTLLYYQTKREMPLPVLIFTEKKYDPGAGILLPLVEKGIIKVIYLKNTLKDLPISPEQTILNTFLGKKNLKHDAQEIRKIIEVKEEIGFADKKEITEICLSLFSYKYSKELTLEEMNSILQIGNQELYKTRVFQDFAKIVREESIQEGILEGKREGILEGIEKGIEKGMEKGILEGKKEDVIQMLALGLDIDLIVQITKLPKNLILSIQKEKQ